jgi:uncharacterized protein (TIRG00374 family)
MTAVALSDEVLVEPVVVRPVTAKAATTRRTKWKALAFVVMGSVTVVEIVLAAPYLDRAMDALDSPDLRWLALALVAELMSISAFARVQRRMLAAGGARVPMHRMAALTYAANAVSRTFPGGPALSSGYVFKRLRSWGASVPAAGFTLLASGVLSTLSFAVLAVIGAVVAGNGGLSSILVIAAVVVVAIAALITRRHHQPDLLIRVASRGLVRTNRILRRAPESGLAGLHRVAGELSAIKPRNRDWLAGFSFAGLNWIADLACLLACCHAVGATGSSLALVTVAFLAGMSASSLPLLPGGLGVVDAAMIIALTQGGVSAVPATAAVLLYRLISFALIVALGWLVWGAVIVAPARHGSLHVVRGERRHVKCLLRLARCGKSGQRHLDITAPQVRTDGASDVTNCHAGPQQQRQVRRCKLRTHPPGRFGLFHELGGQRLEAFASSPALLRRPAGGSRLEKGTVARLQFADREHGVAQCLDRVSSLRRVGHYPSDDVEAIFEERVEYGVLVDEVPVDGSDADPRPAGEFVEGDLESVLGDQLVGRLE